MVKNNWLAVGLLAGTVFFAFRLLNQDEGEFEVAIPKPTPNQIRAKEEVLSQKIKSPYYLRL